MPAYITAVITKLHEEPWLAQAPRVGLHRFLSPGGAWVPTTHNHAQRHTRARTQRNTPLREIPISQTDIIRLAGDQHGVALAQFAWGQKDAGGLHSRFGQGRGSASVFDVSVQAGLGKYATPRGGRGALHGTTVFVTIQLPVWASNGARRLRHGGTKGTLSLSRAP